jgi:hypothetical protein
LADREKILAGRVGNRTPGGEGEKGHVAPEPDTMLHHVGYEASLLNKANLQPTL